MTENKSFHDYNHPCSVNEVRTVAIRNIHLAARKQGNDYRNEAKSVNQQETETSANINNFRNRKSDVLKLIMHNINCNHRPLGNGMTEMNKKY